MNKIMVYSYSGLLLSSKKEQNINKHNNLDGSQRHCVEIRKSQKVAYCMIPFYITFLIRQNYGNRDKSVDCQGLG